MSKVLESMVLTIGLINIEEIKKNRKVLSFNAVEQDIEQMKNSLINYKSLLEILKEEFPQLYMANVIIREQARLHKKVSDEKEKLRIHQVVYQESSQHTIDSINNYSEEIRKNMDILKEVDPYDSYSILMSNLLFIREVKDSLLEMYNAEVTNNNVRACTAILKATTVINKVEHMLSDIVEATEYNNRVFKQ